MFIVTDRKILGKTHLKNNQVKQPKARPTSSSKYLSFPFILEKANGHAKVPASSKAANGSAIIPLFVRLKDLALWDDYV